MQIIDPRNDDNSVFALVYGGSGTGKTHFIGTLGSLGRVLVIDADQGYKTLISKNVPNLTDAMRNNITITTFDAFGDLNKAYHLVEKNDPVEWSRFFTQQAKQEVTITEKFDWIVWDTWTEVQWYMMQELRKKESLLSANMGKDIDFRKNVGIQHWGMLTDLNKLAIEQLRECTKKHACNQVFVMQEIQKINETLGTVEKGPSIHGKMVGEMPSYFDFVVHTYTSPTGEYCATTARKQGWTAKTRNGAGKDFKNPTAKEVFEL